MTLVLATNNKHKVKEIKAILKRVGLKINVKTMDAFPKIKPVIENKPTIEGNAAKKAREVALQSKCFALADDTGLFIRALKGRPGVYSARFAGPRCNFKDNNQKVLRLMKNTPLSKRGAIFRTVAALSTPKGRVFRAEGKIVGKIAVKMSSGKGFGYDPVFYVPKYKKTFSQMSAKLKNQISHRGLAFSKISGLLKKVLKKYN